MDEILGFIVAGEVNSPSGIPIRIPSLERIEGGKFAIHLECPPESYAMFESEMADENLMNTFLNLVLKVLVSKGLPAEECQTMYCGNSIMITFKTLQS